MADPTYIIDGTLTDGEAWVAVDSTTLSSDAGSVSFTSGTGRQNWSQYLDLVVVAYARSSKSAADDTAYFRLNGDSGSNYASQHLSGDGSSATAWSSSSTTYIQQGAVPASTTGSNMFGAVISFLFDINSGKYKTIVSRGAADRDGAGNVDEWGSVWRSQDPVTTIFIGCTSGNVLAGSRVDLFGILPRMVS